MIYKTIQQTGSIIPIAQNYRDCIKLIRSDYYRCKGRNTSLFLMWVYSLFTSNFGFLFWLRLSSYKGFLYPICRFFHRMYYLRYGLEITPDTLVGYGLYLSHGHGIIVNPSAIIGNNCNLSQFSTIGANGDEKAAIVGDNVYIGPNVCVVGNVVIGSLSTIGAGAVVVKDVSENITVAGVPAKEISHNKPGRFVNRRFIME